MQERHKCSLNKKFKKYKNVKIIAKKKESKRVYRSNTIHYTKYATFLYDDDVMDSISQIYKENFKDKKIFSFDVNRGKYKKNVKFNKLKILYITKEEALSVYYGNNFNKI